MIQIKKIQKLLFLLFLFFLVLSISFVYLFYPGIFTGDVTKNLNNTLHVQETQVTVEVTDKRIIGLDVENKSLTLGLVMRSNYVEKGATIINPFSKEINVLASLSEDINDFITISEENFVLGPGQSKKIMIKAEPLEETPIGKYNGTMKIVMNHLS